MSYRDLRNCRGESPGARRARFEAGCRYAQFLWLRDQPARAILALCRALYVSPVDIRESCRQPWNAYVWFLHTPGGNGFLGNPRISFIHQATRTDPSRPLQRQRAWALWHLTRRARPDFPPDPEVPEFPPDPASLRDYLDLHGFRDEGRRFMDALSTAGETRPKAPVPNQTGPCGD
jgi:hypothetical protein